MGNYTPREKSTDLTKGKEIVKRRTSSKAKLSYNEIKEMKYLPKGDQIYRSKIYLLLQTAYLTITDQKEIEEEEETENLSITKENFRLRLRSLNSRRKPKRIAR
ncbi:hypothetical protein M9H77_28163 [Catharanthus roseus]|uniref:Uncharacterized protein n=1 Tax=Catharanthus roseus TaxID=4058 RepID=A0ACC0AG76_CATRO|nr:hypothetical protein M9H77_28163 [Catharanthus roseus]